MTQLTYEPAFDPYHSVFRLLRLKRALPERELFAVEKIRILDFYLLYPFLITAMRLKTEDIAFRKVAKKFEDRRSYGRQPNSTTIFARMEPIQNAALSTLADQKLIDANELEIGRVKFLGISLNDSLDKKCDTYNEQDADLIEILQKFATTYELSGRNGLKDRTGLLEFRNDAL